MFDLNKRPKRRKLGLNGHLRPAEGPRFNFTDTGEASLFLSINHQQQLLDLSLSDQKHGPRPKKQRRQHVGARTIVSSDESQQREQCIASNTINQPRVVANIREHHRYGAIFSELGSSKIRRERRMGLADCCRLNRLHNSWSCSIVMVALVLCGLVSVISGNGLLSIAGDNLQRRQQQQQLFNHTTGTAPTLGRTSHRSTIELDKTTLTNGQQYLESISSPSSDINNLRPSSNHRQSSLHSFNDIKTSVLARLLAGSGQQLTGQQQVEPSASEASTRLSKRSAVDEMLASQSTQLVSSSQPISASTDLMTLVQSATNDHDTMVAEASKKKKKMEKKKKKMEKKHKEWKKGKKHKKKKYESKKKKGGMEKKKKGKKEKKKWGEEKKGHKKKGDFKKKKWGHKKKMKKGHKKGKKGHKMLKDKGHKKKGFKKVYHKEEWGKKKKWHDIKREKKWNTKQKKWKKKWHQEKGKKYKGKHMKKYHKKNKHGKKYKKEKKEKYKKHKGEKFKKGHKKKKEEYSKKKEGGKKKKMKKFKKEEKKKKKG